MKILSELPLDGSPMHRIGGKDLCDLLGLSPAGLADLKKRGFAVHVAHDAYDLEATVRAYVRHLRSMAAGWGDDDQPTGSSGLTAERTRLAKEQADAQAIKNARARGDLVEAVDVERRWQDILRQVRSRILAVPSRLVSNQSLLPEDTAALDRELREALTELGNETD